MLDFAFLMWLLGAIAGSVDASQPPAAPGHRVEFARDVRPILENRCQPCHFPGGTMHAKLPFDQPETIHELGDRLFTRIRNEREQAVIRAFLAQR